MSWGEGGAGEPAPTFSSGFCGSARNRSSPSTPKMCSGRARGRHNQHRKSPARHLLGAQVIFSSVEADGLLPPTDADQHRIPANAGARRGGAVARHINLLRAALYKQRICRRTGGPTFIEATPILPEITAGEGGKPLHAWFTIARARQAKSSPRCVRHTSRVSRTMRIERHQRRGYRHLWVSNLAPLIHDVDN